MSLKNRTQLLFSDRSKLAGMYDKWINETGAADVPINVITFLSSKNLINHREALNLIKESEENYQKLHFTHCRYCGKRIIVDIPYEAMVLKECQTFSCNDCVPEFSLARNGIDESQFVDISNKLFEE